MTTETADQVAAFYIAEAKKSGLKFSPNERRDISFHSPNDQIRKYDLTNTIYCFGSGKFVGRKMAANTLIFLDPKVKDEDDLIVKLLPGVKVSGLVFLIGRGYTYYG